MGIRKQDMEMKELGRKMKEMRTGMKKKGIEKNELEVKKLRIKTKECRVM